MARTVADETEDTSEKNALKLLSDSIINAHKRVDSVEQMIAQLMLSIADLWAGVEAMIIQLLGEATDEDKIRFNEEMNQRRNEMFQGMNDAAKSVATETVE